MKKRLPFSVLTILFSILLVSILAVFFINHLFKTEVIQQQKQKLTREAQLILSQNDQSAHLTEENLSKEYLNNLKKMVAGTDERITLLTTDGQILYDTSTKQGQPIEGDRSQRPEIKAVRAGADYGMSLRKSPTFEEDYLYMAFPIQHNGKLLGMLRISEKFAGFSTTIQRLRFFLFLFVGLLFVILLILLSILLKQRNEPFKTLLPVLKELKDHPEKQKNIIQNSSEWQDLYDTVNEITQEFSKTYQIYTSNEERFNLLLKDLMIGVFMIDKEQMLTMMNPKMLDLLSIHSPPKFPVPYLELIQQLPLTDLIQLGLQEGKDQSQEIILHNGGEKVIDLALRNLPVDDNQPIQIIGVAYDLTNIRHLETMQRDFVSNVSHELKTPVTSLIGFTETLLDGGLKDPNTLEEFLRIIQKEAFRLESLIQDILQLSKGENTYLERKPQFWNPSLATKEILASYPMLITRNQLTIVTTIEESLVIFINETLISAILKNLIENAIQYSLENGIITITIQKKENNLFIKIQDTGIGISEDDQTRIFERFYRVDRARSRNSGGTGLGLAIVAHYVTLLDGTISIESQLSVGTIFSVLIPLISENKQ